MEQLYSLFVKHHRKVLIQDHGSVTPVMPIADALKDNETISLETHKMILEASVDAKMTVLLNALSTDKARSSFYKELKDRVPKLVKELEDQDAQHVDHHQDTIIQKTKLVMPIADTLKARRIIHEETYSKISAGSTTMDQMRTLLDALSTNKEKSAFYNLLKLNNFYLVEVLEQEGIEQGMAGSSAQPLSKVLKTEPHTR